MKNRLLLSTFLIISLQSLAIKPKTEYSYKPSAFGVPFTEQFVTTADNKKINTWYMPASKSPKGTVVMACGDAGNMGEWFGYTGIFLSENYEVYMFDYRGFGSSDSFDILPNNLYHTEFVTDLSAVVDYAKNQGAKDITIFGASMGGIIAVEYLKNKDTSTVKRLILDSYVGASPAVVQHIKAANGVDIEVPQSVIEGRIIAKTLVLLGLADRRCAGADVDELKSIAPNNQIIIFDCGHLQAFDKYPQWYCEAIYRFIEQ